jgi:hypothetical protein
MNTISMSACIVNLRIPTRPLFVPNILESALRGSGRSCYRPAVKCIRFSIGHTKPLKAVECLLSSFVNDNAESTVKKLIVTQSLPSAFTAVPPPQKYE